MSIIIVYDSYERLVSVLNDGYRVSDSIYHLTGARLFEGKISGNFIQGTYYINPYYEIKINSGNEVFIAKNIFAGSRMVATKISNAPDLAPSGLGCSTVGDRFAVISGRAAMLGIICLFIPALLIVIAATGGLNPENFVAHKYRNSFIILMAVPLPVTIHILPEGSSSFVNYKPLLHKNHYSRTKGIAIQKT